MIPSTISFADIYGSRAPTGEKVGPTDKERASGDTVPATDNQTKYFWVSLVVLLIVIRVLWEKGN